MVYNIFSVSRSENKIICQSPSRLNIVSGFTYRLKIQVPQLYVATRGGFMYGHHRGSWGATVHMGGGRVAGEIHLY